MGEANETQDKLDQAKFAFRDHEPTNFFQIYSADQINLKQTQVFDLTMRPPDIVDLNLRLSLGGIYNTGNYTKEKPLTLTRSSSIAGEVTLRKTPSQLEKSLPKSFLSLARSCSLPAEVERSKRMVSVKELRIMRRVQAKKRVVEKQRNSKITNDQKEKLIITEGPPSSPSKVPAWAAASAAKSPALNRAIDKIKEGFRKLEGLEGSSITKVPSERIPSYKPIKAEAEPVIFSEIAASNEKYAKLNPAETNFQSPIKKAKLSKNGYIHLAGIDVMKKMPSVTTTGDGPNGRKIEGFLYKYMKGQVSIVCVCHGSFLSPEEFVKHAGRIDVTNPMKHINVCTTSFSY